MTEISETITNNPWSLKSANISILRNTILSSSIGLFLIGLYSKPGILTKQQQKYVKLVATLILVFSLLNLLYGLYDITAFQEITNKAYEGRELPYIYQVFNGRMVYQQVLFMLYLVCICVFLYILYQF